MSDTNLAKQLSELIELQKETNALMAIFLKKETLQSVLIEEMGKVGMSPKRISILLNTTPNTVNVALSKSRKKK